MHRFREPVNGFTHLAGAALAGCGLIWLLHLTQNDMTRLIPLTIYGLSTFCLYLASATYHLASASETTLLWLRRLDHAAIYLMIAGTYTPFLYYCLDDPWRWNMLLLVWGLAAIGIIYKLMFLQQSSLLSLLYYVGVGCVGLIALPQAAKIFSPPIALPLIAGGVCYLIGAVIFGIEKPNLHPHFGHHEIWHLLVLSGSAFHFVAILRCFA